MKDFLMMCGVMFMGFSWFAILIRLCHFFRWRYIGGLFIVGAILLLISFILKKDD